MHKISGTTLLVQHLLTSSNTKKVRLQKCDSESSFKGNFYISFITKAIKFRVLKKIGSFITSQNFKHPTYCKLNSMVPDNIPHSSQSLQILLRNHHYSQTLQMDLWE